MEPAAGGDEAAPPRPDIHCWESTADAKPGFDKQTDAKTTLGRWQFVQSNCHLTERNRDGSLSDIIHGLQTSQQVNLRRGEKKKGGGTSPGRRRASINLFSHPVCPSAAPRPFTSAPSCNDHLLNKSQQQQQAD